MTKKPQNIKKRLGEKLDGYTTCGAISAVPEPPRPIL